MITRGRMGMLINNTWLASNMRSSVVYASFMHLHKSVFSFLSSSFINTFPLNLGENLKIF